MSGWISVGDALPPMGKRVLMARHGCIQIGERIAKTGWMNDRGYWHWLLESPPVWWRPLDSPPAES